MSPSKKNGSKKLGMHFLLISITLLRSAADSCKEVSWALLPETEQVRCVLKPRRCPDVKWAFHVRCISWTVPRSDYWRHIYLKNIGSCVQTWAVTRPHSCVVFPKRRKIILRFWNYPLVEEFLRNEPLYKNHHAFTIPLLSTLTSPTCKSFIKLC